MKQRTSNNAHRKRNNRLKNRKLPKPTLRFCVVCETERHFKYNRMIFHSECVNCGARFGIKKKQGAKLMEKEQLIALRKNLTKQVNTFKNWVHEAENKIKWIDKQLK